MTLRCKPGDMAIIEGARKNNGMIVEVVSEHPPREDDGAMWNVKPLAPIHNLDGELTTTGWIGDKFLRPIRPPETPMSETRDHEVTA
jgi:hypothetical protein